LARAARLLQPKPDKLLLRRFDGLKGHSQLFRDLTFFRAARQIFFLGGVALQII
jgi:hypothetical protein